MATPVIMPRQGQSVETCIITLWHKGKGEKVSEGDILFSYETDKAAFDEEAKVSGVLLDVFYNEGDEVPVLVNIAVIGEPGENYDEYKPGGQADTGTVEKEKQQVTESSSVSTPLVGTTESATSNGKQRISPLARKLSKELGVDTLGLKGTGPNGRIIRSDIEVAAKNIPVKSGGSPAKSGSITGQIAVSAPKQVSIPEPVVLEENLNYRTEKLPNIRKIIAAKMHESLQQSAQLTHHLSADARKLLSSRKKFKQLRANGEITEDITINDLVCYAVVRALQKHPVMNAHFMGDTMRMFKNVHLGFAVDTPRGLMVPALQNADDLNIKGLSARLKTLAQQCKDGTVNPDLLASTAASFTISNLGAFGIEMFTPVLNLPQTGILGVNTITYRPADLGDGTIGFVPHIGLSLTYDHRAVDGAPASAFLKEIKQQIEGLNE